MKKALIVLLILAGLVSCKQNNRFSVSGTVKNAEGKMLYIEHTGLLKTTVLDSVKLNKNGAFKFKSARPAYPDFYRLRLNEKIISFAVDSCEDITIEAKANNFASEYILTGSKTSNEIQKLRKPVMSIQLKINSLTPELGFEERNTKIAEIEKDIEAHKKMARNLILQNPRSSAAYFAIYQKINDTFLFSPYIKTDKPYFAAVATAYNAFMPEYERSKNLYILVMDAIKTEREAKEKDAWNKILEKIGKGYIDISLKNNKNAIRKLSDLEGKVILIDFSTYENKESAKYTLALRELYNKYHSRGFEIYQISLDQDKLFWEQSVKNIPWICVRDDDGPNTTYATSYNISSIPTMFLMNKQGIIIARNLLFEDLKAEIEKNLSNSSK